MTEEVRLVIWDLDETFWSGTLTEGGIRYQRAAHNIVTELAGRGIMSSICSKNDFDAVREILIAEGIWEYFIFPSINWQPKGQRVAQIVEDAQLRAPSVLLIDDNPMNRNEALHFVSGLQVADETLLSTMLVDPRFAGKDDCGHSRLKQYKVLERRRESQTHHDDNFDFLRSSGIRVHIENDVEANIDRAVELINRTNQLNFTKRRLPEDLGGARAQLRQELHERNTQAGLVHVSDNYGDYGFSGIYLLHVHTWRLVHYCFSCRTIGIGVERWLFQRLNRPAIAVVGEVLTNLYEAEPSIDWINGGKAVVDKHHRVSGRVFVRGGCEIQALAHYFALDAEQLETEFAFSRGGLPVPINHSVFLRAAIDGISDSEISAARMLGYEAGDFESRATMCTSPFDLYVYSFWADAQYALYRDRETSIRLPFGIHGLNNGADLRSTDVDHLRTKLTEPGMKEKMEVLRERFEYMGWSPGIRESSGETLLEQNLCVIFSSCPPMAKIFVLLGCEQVYDAAGLPQPVLHHVELNRVTRRAAEGMSHVYFLAPDEFIMAPTDVIDATHWDRRVYYRIYQRIAELHQIQCPSGKDA